MKFENEQAEGLGLKVAGKGNTALVHPVHGFEGRRIYVDGGSKKSGIEGPCIHLSGFTDEEVELLGATKNTAGDYSARIRGFLKLNPENLKNAAQVLRDATTPAFVPARGAKVDGVDVKAIFAAAASK